MHVVSVNVALPHEVALPGGVWRTAILKVPVAGPVRISALGLEGDGQGDQRHHGGLWQPVFLLASEHYAYWNEQLARDEGVFEPFAPGSLGENLTTTGVLETDVRIGDVLRIGTAVLAVTHPRRPCATLEARTGIRGFTKRYLEARRPGFYLRVLEEGDVTTGDAIEIVPREGDALSIAQLNEMRHFASESASDLRRAIDDEHLTPGWRAHFETRTRSTPPSGSSTS